jgi:hypothetical protein
MSTVVTCGHCGADLVDGSITTAEGVEVRVAECPNGDGKIKSPLCCGTDMTCSI